MLRIPCVRTYHQGQQWKFEGGTDLSKYDTMKCWKLSDYFNEFGTAMKGFLEGYRRMALSQIRFTMFNFEGDYEICALQSDGKTRLVLSRDQPRSIRLGLVPSTGPCGKQVVSSSDLLLPVVNLTKRTRRTFVFNMKPKVYADLKTLTSKKTLKQVIDLCDCTDISNYVIGMAMHPYHYMKDWGAGEYIVCYLKWDMKVTFVWTTCSKNEINNYN